MDDNLALWGIRKGIEWAAGCLLVLVVVALILAFLFGYHVGH